MPVRWSGREGKIDDAGEERIAWFTALSSKRGWDVVHTWSGLGKEGFPALAGGKAKNRVPGAGSCNTVAGNMQKFFSDGFKTGTGSRVRVMPGRKWLRLKEGGEYMKYASRIVGEWMDMSRASREEITVNPDSSKCVFLSSPVQQVQIHGRWERELGENCLPISFT